MTAARITLAGVSKTLGRRRVLDAVDLDVSPGTITVVLGASGAGKSTMLRLIAGLLDPDAGSITIDGQAVADPVARVPAERRGVGMVFQGLELFPHLTVAENAAFGLVGRPRGAMATAHPRVREVLALVGLSPSLAARLPATLSGGERQRTAIARALAPGPRVLLYDEPLANLDPSRRSDLRGLVRRLGSGGETTVLYVTHDAAEALELGHEIVVLEGGRIVDRGTPESLLAAPRCLASARALGPVSVLAADSVAARRWCEGAKAPAGSLVLLRPEHVALDDGAGTAAVVTDAYLAGSRYAFEARLDGAGDVVRGLSSQRLVAGASIHLRFVGRPPVVAAESPGSDA